MDLYDEIIEEVKTKPSEVSMRLHILKQVYDHSGMMEYVTMASDKRVFRAYFLLEGKKDMLECGDLVDVKGLLYPLERLTLTMCADTGTVGIFCQEHKFIRWDKHRREEFNDVSWCLDLKNMAKYDGKKPDWL